MIFVGLLTHKESKYFINSNHHNFNLLKRSCEANTHQIHSADKYGDEDVSRFQVFN